MTITLQIGNTDNKLSQQHWADFVKAVERELKHRLFLVHFSGGPPTHWPFQSWAWIFECDPLEVEALKATLKQAAHFYRDASCTWSESTMERL